MLINYFASTLSFQNKMKFNPFAENGRAEKNNINNGNLIKF